MIHLSGEPKLPNKCRSGRNYVKQGVLSGSTLLLVFFRMRGATNKLQNFGVSARGRRRMSVIVETPFAVITSALAKPWWLLRTGTIIVGVAGTNRCFTGKVFTRKKKDGPVVDATGQGIFYMHGWPAKEVSMMRKACLSW